MWHSAHTTIVAIHFFPLYIHSRSLFPVLLFFIDAKVCQILFVFFLSNVCLALFVEAAFSIHVFSLVSVRSESLTTTISSTEVFSCWVPKPYIQFSSGLAVCGVICYMDCCCFLFSLFFSIFSPFWKSSQLQEDRRGEKEDVSVLCYLNNDTATLNSSQQVKCVHLRLLPFNGK